MSQVITCPNCDKKLAIRDEFKGRDLICPQCKGRFTAPADEPAATEAGFGAMFDESPSPGGSEMAFLDSLTSAAGPAAKTATKTSAAGRQAAAARPTAGKAPAAVSAASRAAASRAKNKNDQMMLIYIGGGIAAAVLVVILLVAAMPSGGGGGGGGNKNMRFGMTESQRKRLFKDLFHAVDELGPNKECRDEWRHLGSNWNLTDQQISEIRKEGMDSGWEQPAIPATTDQKQKTNRREWIRIMTETNREPVMSQ